MQYSIIVRTVFFEFYLFHKTTPYNKKILDWPFAVVKEWIVIIIVENWHKLCDQVIFSCISKAQYQNRITAIGTMVCVGCREH